MNGGKSIFAKAMGWIGLFGAGDAVAETSYTAAQRAETVALQERELRSLRLVVRAGGYAAERNQILAERGAKGDETIFSTAFAPGLELIIVADSSSTSRPWMQHHLNRYQVSQKEIMELGRKQVLAILPSLPSKEDVAGGVVMIPKTDHLASLMFADGWDDLDRALDGNLVVAVPSDDVLIVADGTRPEILAKLPGFVKRQYAEAHRAVSHLLYRRKDGRWIAAD